MQIENDERFYALTEQASGIRADATRRQVLEILGNAFDNAYDTIRVEKAAPASDWDALFVGTLQSQLSQGVNRHIKAWFASRGITY
jgi:hypothetical protein